MKRRDLLKFAGYSPLLALPVGLAANVSVSDRAEWMAVLSSEDALSNPYWDGTFAHSIEWHGDRGHYLRTAHALIGGKDFYVWDWCEDKSSEEEFLELAKAGFRNRVIRSKARARKGWFPIHG